MLFMKAKNMNSSAKKTQSLIRNTFAMMISEKKELSKKQTRLLSSAKWMPSCAQATKYRKKAHHSQHMAQGFPGLL